MLQSQREPTDHDVLSCTERPRFRLRPASKADHHDAEAKS